MQKILEKIFIGDSYKACEQILETYNKQGYCILNYLYFANVVSKQLLKEHHKSWIDLNVFKNLLLSGYKKIALDKIYNIYRKAILTSDFLLPDGIALQIFYYIAKRKRLENLN